MSPHFLHAPLTFDALVVETTTRCNAACGMCYQGAGAKGSDYLGDAALAPDEVARLVTQAARIPSLRPRFHLSGGEAFIHLDDCLRLFRHARDAGFSDVSATSNAYWAADVMKARTLAKRLRQSGLGRLEISWDIWHQPWISPSAVSNAITACHAAGVDTTLRLLTTRDHTVEEALALLDPGAVARATVISSAPVMAVGRATQLPRDTIYGSGEQGSCHHVLNLTVNARGDVSPCCAGFDQTGAALFGNVRQEALDEIAAAMNQSLLLRLVVFEGLGALRPLLQAAGIDDLDAAYTGICHMCWDVFSRPERVQRLEAHLEALQARALDHALHGADDRAEAAEAA